MPHLDPLERPLHGKRQLQHDHHTGPRQDRLAELQESVWLLTSGEDEVAAIRHAGKEAGGPGSRPLLSARARGHPSGLPGQIALTVSAALTREGTTTCRGRLLLAPGSKSAALAPPSACACRSPSSCDRDRGSSSGRRGARGATVFRSSPVSYSADR